MKRIYKAQKTVCIKSFKSCLTFLWIVMIAVQTAMAQTTVTGKVMDEAGVMPFCTVAVSGSVQGAITDAQGKFSLANVLPADTLVVSFIGYHTQRLPVGNRSYFEVTLVANDKTLEEIVVVGFGTQRKVNVTGAVAAVEAAQIENRGVTNASNILAGQASGVTILQRGGTPGRNAGQIRIRGIGTLGGDAKNEPLIIVDGIETGSLTEINPENIASISVLKDAAAAAIYGVRAANGVLLITTKRGRVGKVQIRYGFQYGLSRPTRLPEKVNAFELATLYNEAEKNAGTTVRLFTKEDRTLFRLGTALETHANSNPIGEVFTQHGIRHVHHLSVLGGGNLAQYNVSLGYTEEQGFMPNTGLKRYTFRANLDFSLTKTLQMTLNLAGAQRQIADPIYGVGGILHRAYREWANDAIQTKEGKWAYPIWGKTQGIQHNAVASLRDGGRSNTTDSRFTGTWMVTYSPWDFLSIKGIAATVQDFNRKKTINQKLTLYQPSTDSAANTSASQVFEGRDNISDINLQLLVNFEKSWNKHEVKALLGFNSRSKENIITALSAKDLISNTMDQINAADKATDEVNGNTTDYRLLSYFGRLRYNYDEKYLLEANLRYDGTSRFPAARRFGLFPSVSVGWRVSQENFFQVNAINELKVRGSWGRLGNQEIGEYAFSNYYVFDQEAYIGGKEQTGATERIPFGNSTITWETTETFNYGLDVSVLEGSLSLSGDYFIRKTHDVLIQKPLAAIFGVGTATGNFPYVNGATTENKGFELSLDYTKTLGEWNVRASLNFSKVSTRITDLLGTDRPGMRVGDPIANIFGYEALGIFQNQAEIDAHADQLLLGQKPKPGDMKYRDISGPDGVPDGKINADYDRKNLGSFFPSINYGFSFRLEYKGFDLGTTWQGVAEVQAEMGGRQRQPFILGASPWKQHLNRAIIDRDGHVENPNARYPRTLLPPVPKNYATSSWWVESTAFLKLRNAQLGYSFSPDILQKIKISRLRVYLSGENLLLFTPFQGFDPEIPTKGAVLPTFSGNSGYPVATTYVLGINLTF